MRVGDRVTSSTQLTTVDKPGSLEAYIYVPVERAPELKPGLRVQIVDKDGNPLADSKITFISPQVDTTTQTCLAKASIANSNDKLRNAQFIRARIVGGPPTSLSSRCLRCRAWADNTSRLSRNPKANPISRTSSRSA